MIVLFKKRTSRSFVKVCGFCRLTELFSLYNTFHLFESLRLFCWLTAPVTGVYSDWSHWLPCSATCGGGTQERTRKCSFPKDAKGGVDCSSLGPSLETRECNALLCPGMLQIDHVVVNHRKMNVPVKKLNTIRR